MSKRRLPLRPWIVGTLSERIIVPARTRGHAVKQFRQGRNVTIQTDHETGGWKGVSAEVATDQALAATRRLRRPSTQAARRIAAEALAIAGRSP